MTEQNRAKRPNGEDQNTDQNAAKTPILIKIFAKILAYIRKKQYLCNEF